MLRSFFSWKNTTLAPAFSIIASSPSPMPFEPLSSSMMRTLTPSFARSASAFAMRLPSLPSFHRNVS